MHGSIAVDVQLAFAVVLTPAMVRAEVVDQSAGDAEFEHVCPKVVPSDCVAVQTQVWADPSMKAPDSVRWIGAARAPSVRSLKLVAIVVPFTSR